MRPSSTLRRTVGGSRCVDAGAFDLTTRVLTIATLLTLLFGAAPCQVAAAPRLLLTDYPYGDQGAFTLKGRVVNVDGTPAVGARVCAGPSEATADARGLFAVEGVNAGATRVCALAADGQTFGSASVKYPVVVLRPQALVPPDRNLARQIMDQLKKDAAGTRWAEYSLYFAGDVEAANPSAPLSPVGYGMACQDSRVATATLLDVYFSSKSAWARRESGTVLVMSRIDWTADPRASDFFSQFGRGFSPEPGTSADILSGERDDYLLALASAQDQEGQTQQADANLAEGIASIHAHSGGDYSSEIARSNLLMSSPRLFERLLKRLPKTRQLQVRALGIFLTQFTRHHSVLDDLPYLQREQSCLEAEKQAKPHDQDRENQDMGIYRRSLWQAIHYGGAENPATALQLALQYREPVPLSPYTDVAENKAGLVMEASWYQTPTLQKKLCRAWANREPFDEEIAAAGRLLPIDPAYAHRLYLDSLRKEWGPAVFIVFPWYQAPFAPARARFTLECHWADELSDDQDEDHDFEEIVVDMARVSPQRALQMALEIPNDSQGECEGFSARQALANYLWTGEGPVDSSRDPR